jgi:integrase
VYAVAAGTGLRRGELQRLRWSDLDLEAYLKEHQLPNEWDYFDPAKADDKRECGLHARWGQEALGSGI